MGEIFLLASQGVEGSLTLSCREMVGRSGRLSCSVLLWLA